MSTRISGGTDRGRKLQIPRGRLRPTTERVRSAIFSMLGDRVVRAKVLDLYAGSGALGLEALSRGAYRVDFMEENARHCKVIDANIRSLGYDDRTRVIRRKVASLPTVLAGSRKNGPGGERYDLVFIDPPYDDDPWGRILPSLSEGGFLGGNAWVVAEHKSNRNLELIYGSLMLTSRKAYGDSAISMFTVASENG